VQVRPLPSGRVVLSRPCERYHGPLRLPGQPPATSGSTLIRRGGTPVVHWTGSPVVPCEAVRACRPCYPGGSGRAGQLYRLVRHRPSPNVHRVGTLTFVTRLRLGSLHATACAVARPSGALVRELGALGYPAHLPQATWATLPTPRAGLPPASLTVSTACGRSALTKLIRPAGQGRSTDFELRIAHFELRGGAERAYESVFLDGGVGATGPAVSLA